MSGTAEAPRTQAAERGSATAVSLLVGFALIVFPVMVLVLSLPAWEQRVVDAQDAARAGALALAIAPDWAAGTAAAAQVSGRVLEADGVPAQDVGVAFEGSLEPGSTVSVAVTVTVPAGALPGLGAVGTLRYTARSTQHVDSYRGSI
jgi:hypothetical protein